MAMLRAAEQDLKRQRDMIDNLITRVKEHGAHPVLAESPPAPTPSQEVPVDFMKTARVQAFDPSRSTPRPIPAPRAPSAPAPVSAPAPAAASAPKPAPVEKPLVADDAFAFLGNGAETTQPVKPLEKVAETTQRVPDAERTQQIPALDPNFKPEDTQAMPAFAANPGTVPGGETTQRLDASIQRLQEAKRLLQKQ
jgi:hypothetical protein